MQPKLLAFFVLFVTIGAAFGSYPLPRWDSPDARPWPLPQSVSNGTQTLAVFPANFVFVTKSSSGILQRAITRYSNLIASSSPLSPVSSQTVDGTITELDISVSNDDESLGPNTDESYTLDIPSPSSSSSVAAKLSAPTVFGALRGLESFVQMVESVAESDKIEMKKNNDHHHRRRFSSSSSSSPVTHVIRGCPWQIKDSPRFSHRALLIDTARHFLPVSVILEHIDAMSYNKLNVLHWHLVDSQTFPFQSESAPLISRGSWGPKSIYSRNDISSVVDYARDRGVRVMPEIDTPGHATSWGVGYPEVLTACPNILKTRGDAYGTLDPSNNRTFEIVEDLLAEFGSLFPDEMFHLGGDEVISLCWEESARVTTFMGQMGFTSYDQLETYYFQRLLEIASRVLSNKTLVVYQDVFDNNVSLPPNVVFDVWRGDNIGPEMTNIIKKGHRVVLANGNQANWYLNDGFGNGNVVSLWPVVYSLDPIVGTLPSSLDPKLEELIVGGEASMWGEEVNKNNLMEKFWPRASAFAEKMWSAAADTQDSVPAASRLARLYCRLEARGVRVSPISPGSCERW